MTNIAIKNTPFSSLIYPLNIVNFHSYVNVYQRVNLHFPSFYQRVFLWFSHVTSTTRPGPREFRHDGDASTHGSHGEGETFRGRGAMESGGAFMGKMEVLMGKP